MYINEELKIQWDKRKNGSMRLYSPKSGKKVWWKCKKGHEWEACISTRIDGNTGCPYCCNKKLCKDGSNSLYFYASEQLKKEWNEEKNGSMKLYSPSSGKKVWWKCIKKGHEWEAGINKRVQKHPTGCPYCNQSKLEIQFQMACLKLDINFVSQVKYKNVKNKSQLPYDAVIKYKNKEIRVELQGEQHFNSDNHYYTIRKINSPIQQYIDRLNIDNKKSYSTLKDRHSFLSVSYLCINEISTILSRYLEELENYDILFRYYITPYIYLQYTESNEVKVAETELCCEYTDEMLLIYRIFLYQIESLQNPREISEENFTKCRGKLYFNDTIVACKMLQIE